MSVESCCPVETPQVVPTKDADIKLEGSWVELADMKTYITGSKTATVAINFIYDIFGPSPQALRGADLLAQYLNAIVFVPDYIGPNYATEEMFKDSSEEVQAKKAAFMKTLSYQQHGPVIRNIVSGANTKYPNIERWACFGLCWGGKMTALASAEGTPFVVSGQAHPGSPTRDDAEAIVIPHIVLAAPEDNKAGGIDGYKEIFSKDGSKSFLEVYETMFHGWMGGRANLEDEENFKEYMRGYDQVAKLFAQHL